MPKFNGYINKDGSSSTFCSSGNEAQLGETDILIFSVEAETWEKAMQAWHKFNGWEDYIPLDK